MRGNWLTDRTTGGFRHFDGMSSTGFVSFLNSREIASFEMGSRILSEGLAHRYLKVNRWNILLAKPMVFRYDQS